MKIKKRSIAWAVIIGAGLGLAGAGGYWAGQMWPWRASPTLTQSVSPAPATEFTKEVFELITNQHWEKLDEPSLVTRFAQAIDQVYGVQPELKQKTWSELEKRVENLIGLHPDQNHGELMAGVADLVLRSLQPSERSMIYTQKQTQELQETVANIDTDTDLFATLEVDSEASPAAIREVYKQKKQAVETSTTDSASKSQQLAELERAVNTLGDPITNERYQETKVEPTIYGQALTNNIFFVKIKQFSPTTLEDLDLIFKKLPTGNSLEYLIIDLRGNIGGAIDSLPYLLEPFIGPNQYAYQFFSQGQTLEFKTKQDNLASLGQQQKIVVLTDRATQSSAEVMTAALKKYRAAVVVGTPTKGWGTVERVFPITHQPNTEGDQYAVFLVHSLTLDEVGNPIEGVGVKPHIDITAPNWEKQLLGFFNDTRLINEIKKL